MRLLAVACVVWLGGAALADPTVQVEREDTGSTSVRTSSPPTLPPRSSTPSSSGGCNGGMVFLLVALLAVGFAGGAYHDRMKRHERGPRSGVELDRNADVCALRIALDGRARRFVQAQLARITSSASTASPDMRMAILREVALLLRQQRNLWVYGGAVNMPVQRRDKARRAFARLVDEARTPFSAATTDAHDDGLILVTLVASTRTELITVRDTSPAEDLRVALEAAPFRHAYDLVALEVIWHPAEDTARLSSAELESRYPELVRLVRLKVDTRFCVRCSGPLPAELVSCPHCGAPAREAA
jgi:uncharacterized membrane protein